MPAVDRTSLWIGSSAAEPDRCTIGRACAAREIQGMTKRSRKRQTVSLERRLASEAARLRAEAQVLPPGALREQVLRKADRFAQLAIADYQSRRLQ
jgi:hypothetical protein